MAITAGAQPDPGNIRIIHLPGVRKPIPGNGRQGSSVQPFTELHGFDIVKEVEAVAFDERKTCTQLTDFPPGCPGRPGNQGCCHGDGQTKSKKSARNVHNVTSRGPQVNSRCSFESGLACPGKLIFTAFCGVEIEPAAGM